MPDPLPHGVGLGLRWEFLDEVLAADPLEVAFFEVAPENTLGRGGYAPRAVERVAQRYPMVTHGLTLSLGAWEPPDADYLAQLRDEIARVGARFHSDHLCVSSFGERQAHELLPLRFSRDNARRVAARLDELGAVLGVPLAFENITYYAHPGCAELSEAEFLCSVLEQCSAGLLLDVNNAYVNAQNHGLEAREMIASLPLERVVEIHVAGHTREQDGLLLDTHGTPVADAVCDLLEFTLRRTGPVPVLLERDNDVPELSELLLEVEKLRGIYLRATSNGARDA